MRKPVLSAVIPFLLGVHAAGQVQWQRAAHTDARSGHAMTYDWVRACALVFGGHSGEYLADTWEWDGQRWIERMPGTRPPRRAGHGLTYDVRRNETILFGGIYGLLTPRLGDTWRWNGSDWTQLFPASSPSARSHHAMAYDLPRGRVVLFGGLSTPSGQIMNDTWEWDGSSWNQATPSVAPPARVGHRLAYDLARSRTVMVGGANGTQRFQDTWEWDGQQWHAIPSAAYPLARTEPALVYDMARQRVVLFGGVDGVNGQLDDTWEWDGQAWTQLSVTAPPGRGGPAAAFHVGRATTVMFAGLSAEGHLADTWELGPTGWSLRGASAAPGAGGWRGGLAHDEARGRTLYCGGSPRGTLTWEWDGSTWMRRAPAASPPTRDTYEMALDTRRARVVLFGGAAGGGRGNDTWEWDGAAWRLRAPAQSPPPLRDHAIAWDPRGGRVLLFGGLAQSQVGDTWEWDGTDWRQLTVANPPTARFGHALATDTWRGRIVLFGGMDGQLANDTWEWDGTRWERRMPANQPSPRMDHSLVFDPARGRTILFGGGLGFPSFQRLQDLWEWDGNDWTQRLTAAGPPAMADHAAAWDQANACMVLFGGNGGEASYAHTWLYGPEHPARFSAYGTGCAGTAGTPELRATGGRLPWLGGPFPLQVTRLVAGQPAVLLLGASATAWGTLPLPLDLSLLGMNGCALHASAELAVAMANSSGTAQVQLDVPSVPSLLGGTFFVQALARDPAANAFGAVLSGAGAAQLGGR